MLWRRECCRRWRPALSTRGVDRAWRLRQWRHAAACSLCSLRRSADLPATEARGTPAPGASLLVARDGPDRDGGTTPGDGPDWRCGTTTAASLWRNFHHACHRGRDRPGAARWAAAGQVSSRAPPCVCRVPPGRRSDRIALRGTRTRWHVPRGTAVHQSSMSGTPIRFAFRESRRDRRYRARAPRIATRAIDISSSNLELQKKPLSRVGQKILGPN